MIGVKQPRRLGRWAAVVAIAAIGVTWMAWDTSTDDNPSINGATYDRIDAYVQDQVDDSRIPGVAIAVVEGGRGRSRRWVRRRRPRQRRSPPTLRSGSAPIPSRSPRSPRCSWPRPARVDLDTPVQTLPVPQFRVADAGRVPRRSPCATCSTRPAGIARIDGRARRRRGRGGSDP